VLELDVLVPLLVPEPVLETGDSDEVSEVCCTEEDAVPEGLIPDDVIIGPPGLMLRVLVGEIAEESIPVGTMLSLELATDDIGPPGFTLPLMLVAVAEDIGPPG